MPTANDFRTVQVQASVFTPGLQFRSAKVLGHLLTEYGEKLDGEPLTVPSLVRTKGVSLVQPGPQIILQSGDGHLKLQANAVRVDVIRDAEAMAEDDVRGHLGWACRVALSYLRLNEAKAGRVSCVIHRLGDDPSPAVSLSRHFCKPQWTDGPLNRPTDFELHAHKRFHLGDLFEINSWVRCKTAVLHAEGGPVFPPNAVLVEQDFNSLHEQMESRELSGGEIERFFEVAPREMRRVLEMYFPD